jgi:hypothetical protein
MQSSRFEEEISWSFGIEVWDFGIGISNLIGTEENIYGTPGTKP